MRREAPHPSTADGSLPDDRYLRTLDPWVSLAGAAALTERIELATAVPLPVEHGPVTLAKTIASLHHRSGGRSRSAPGSAGTPTSSPTTTSRPASAARCCASISRRCASSGPQDEASYAGEHVAFGASWAWPKPVRGTVPVLIGAAGTDATFRWIARSADGWITTPRETDVVRRVARLHDVWAAAGRTGSPRVVALDGRLDPDRLAHWAAGGVTDVVYGLPDRDVREIAGYLDRLADRLDAFRARASAATSPA